MVVRLSLVLLEEESRAGPQPHALVAPTRHVDLGHHAVTHLTRVQRQGDGLGRLVRVRVILREAKAQKLLPCANL
jgi:hypothetical protein